MTVIQIDVLHKTHTDNRRLLSGAKSMGDFLSILVS
jgi:hypothetical protein